MTWYPGPYFLNPAGPIYRGMMEEERSKMVNENENLVLATQIIKTQKLSHRNKCDICFSSAILGTQWVQHIFLGWLRT